MAWIVLTVLSYVLLAAVALGDKYFLTGPVRDPKLYAFYVGFLGLIAFVLVPFLGMPVPDPLPLLAACLAGGIFILGAYLLYFGLHYFEASRMVPATGGLVPIFTLLFGLLLLDTRGLGPTDAWAFLALIGGTVLITWRGFRQIFSQTLVVAVATSLFFGASFALSKYAYLTQSFWSAFIWMRVGAGLVSAGIAAGSPLVRAEITKTFFSRKFTRRGERTAGLFILNQSMGAAAMILQNFAIWLVPAAQLAFVNALQGVQYVFLLLFASLLSFRYPHARMHEYVSGTTLAQKIAAILLIAAGLVLLAPAAS